MRSLNKPLRVWHALIAVLAGAALAAGGTAVAGGLGKEADSSATVSGIGAITYGAGSYTYVIDRFTNFVGQQNRGTVRCPGGTHVTGGGVFSSGGFDSQHVNSSFPLDSSDNGAAPDDKWRAYVDNFGGVNQIFDVYAICR